MHSWQPHGHRTSSLSIMDRAMRAGWILDLSMEVLQTGHRLDVSTARLKHGSQKVCCSGHMEACIIGSIHTPQSKTSSGLDTKHSSGTRSPNFHTSNAVGRTSSDTGLGTWLA
eukprot:m.164937 g.164937  ORF g.164937 m.164937 type:complete len:113 (-) comp14413_c0_seq4:252-590(-)